MSSRVLSPFKDGWRKLPGRSKSKLSLNVPFLGERGWGGQVKDYGRILPGKGYKDEHFKE